MQFEGGKKMEKRLKTILIIIVVAIILLSLPLIYWYLTYGQIGLTLGILFYGLIFGIIIGLYLRFKYPVRYENRPRRDQMDININVHGQDRYSQRSRYPENPLSNLGETQRNLDRYMGGVKRQSDRIDMFDNWGYLGGKKKRRR